MHTWSALAYVEFILAECKSNLIASSATGIKTQLCFSSVEHLCFCIPVMVTCYCYLIIQLLY